MKALPLLLAGFLTVCSATASAQAWAQAYEAGLAAARQLKWDDARAAFARAAALRPDDVAGPTTLPGPPTEQRRWRNGSPYSPNFLSAYARYRKALEEKEGSEERTTGLREAAQAFEILVDANQAAPETVFLGAAAYARLGDAEKRNALVTKGAAARRTWKVDTEPVSPEELAQVGGRLGAPDTGIPGAPVTTAVVQPSATNPIPGSGPSFATKIPTKFALIIGNSDNRLPDSLIPFAVDDANRMRDALVNYSGYEEGNVVVVTNATAAGMREAATALAARMPEGGVAFIYYTGASTDVNGKDYLAGVDTESATDYASMLPKSEFYRPFTLKGARIFSFFQTPRLIRGSDYFGREIPGIGSISQMQATLPGDGISYAILDGKPIGVFTQALVAVMEEQRSNRIPISEFGWQVFYKVRRGSSGTTGGAGRQTPTLPLLRFLASDARF